MTIRYEEAIERAQTIVPVAQRNVALAEEMRRMPEENAEAILDSGLMPLMRPKMFGGYEGDWMTQIDCVAEVAQICGSTGWCMTFFIQHQYFLSLFPLEAQRFVYERQPDPTLLTSFNPDRLGQGGARRLRGRRTLAFRLGRRLLPTGRSSAASPGIEDGRQEAAELSAEARAIQHRPGLGCDWSERLGQQRHHRRADLRSGEFSSTTTMTMVGKRAGATRRMTGVLYRSPLVLNSGFAVMTPMHGIARGAYEAFVELTARARRAPAGAQAGRPGRRADRDR